VEQPDARARGNSAPDDHANAQDPDSLRDGEPGRDADPRRVGYSHHAVNRKCLERTLALRQAARTAGVLVCYSATVFRPGYIEVSERNKTFSERKRTGGPAIADPLKVMHPQMQPAEDEPVCGKHRVNAMFDSDLRMILGARNVDTLILLGYATSGVVLSTTRYAADADYRLYIVEDCCADNDPAVHDFLCAKIFPRQADVVQSAELIGVLAAQVKATGRSLPR
jgi:nicotinamidase-related amidase